MDLKTIIAALGPAETDSDADVLKHVIKPGDQNRSLTEANAALTTERDRYKTDFNELKASADGSEKPRC